MRRMKKYSEQGSYFVEIQAPTKRLAERVMRKLEQAVRRLYSSRNRGIGFTQWWFEAPDGPLSRVEDEEKIHARRATRERLGN